MWLSDTRFKAACRHLLTKMQDKLNKNTHSLQVDPFECLQVMGPCTNIAATNQKCLQRVSFEAHAQETNSPNMLSVTWTRIDVRLFFISLFRCTLRASSGSASSSLLSSASTFMPLLPPAGPWLPPPHLPHTSLLSEHATLSRGCCLVTGVKCKERPYQSAQVSGNDFRLGRGHTGPEAFPVVCSRGHVLFKLTT